jgi:hypothetical protein
MAVTAMAAISSQNNTPDDLPIVIIQSALRRLDSPYVAKVFEG